MCDSNGGKNQSAPSIYDFLEKNGTDSVGIGLFLVPDPAAGVLEYRTITVENLTIKETGKRGSTCVAFKFFPYGLDLLDKEKNSVSIRNSSDLEKIYCGSTCNECNGNCWCSHWAGNCIRS